MCEREPELAFVGVQSCLAENGRYLTGSFSRPFGIRTGGGYDDGCLEAPRSTICRGQPDL
jgi:hypothetical protein